MSGLLSLGELRSAAGSLEAVLNASLDDIDDVLGVAYAQVELPVKLDTLPDGDYTKLEASLNIPDDFTVSGVVFDEKNVTGDATYTYQDGRLVLTVSGDNVNYQDNGGTGFATVQLQLTDYTTQNKTVQVRTDYVRSPAATSPIGWTTPCPTSPW